MNTDHPFPATRGPVFWPGDPGYADEVAGYNGIVTHHPSVVVGAADAGDVVAAVTYASGHGISVGVQATGHGISVPADGVLITTHRMNQVLIDLGTHTARVEAGVRSGDLVVAAANHGLAPLNGSSPAVGVVGYTLGGGLPLMGRQFGWAADRVRSLDVVTADGSLRQLTARQEPELFWAMLGGKGNFGVVTALETEILPVEAVVGGGLWFTGERVGPALHAYAEWTTRVPDEMSSSVLLMRMPDQPFIPAPIRGQHVAHIRILHSGDHHEATQLVDQLRAAAPVSMDTVAPMPYREVGRIHNEPPGPVRFEAANSILSSLDQAAVDTFLAHAGPDGTDPGAYLVEARHRGGKLAIAIGRQSVTGRRNGEFTLYTGTALHNADRTAAADAQQRLHHAMRPWGTGGICSSFLSGPSATPAAMRNGFDPEDFDRLQKVKVAIDPSNMFRINPNIEP